jgi:hypothetical protein
MMALDIGLLGTKCGNGASHRHKRTVNYLVGVIGFGSRRCAQEQLARNRMDSITGDDWYRVLKIVEITTATYCGETK